MKRPIDPDLDDFPRVPPPAIWSRENLVEALQEARRMFAEERTENRKLRKSAEALRELVELKDIRAKIDGTMDAFPDQDAFNSAVEDYYNRKPIAWAMARELVAMVPIELVDTNTGEPCPRRGNLLCTITDKSHRHTSAILWQARQGESESGPEILGFTLRSYRRASGENS